MIKERLWYILFNYVRGRHSSGQLANVCKYVLGKKRPVVSWDPVYLTTFTTYRCNLNCDMCLTHSLKHESEYGEKPKEDMSYEIFRRILDRYKKALVVTLTGNGEPLLNKDFFRMAKYASKERGMYVFSASNGTLVDQYQEQLVNSCLDQFSISINGCNPGEYVRLTGMSEKCFEAICKNTRDLVKLRDETRGTKLKIWVSFIVDKSNCGRLTEMVDLGRELGIDGVLFQHFMPNQKDGGGAEDVCLFSDDENVIEQLGRVQKIETDIKMVLPNLLEKAMLNEAEEFKYCKVPFYNLTIDGEGNVGGCGCQLLDNSGNGRFDEQDAWNNDYFRQFRSRFIESDMEMLEPCRRCHNNLPSAERTLSTFLRNKIKRLGGMMSSK